MTNILYVVGDASRPAGTDWRIITHVCNNIGAWGAGFTGALSKNQPNAEVAYRAWSRGKLETTADAIAQGMKWTCSGPLELGQVQLVKGANKVLIANLVGQEGVVSKYNPTPVRYEAIQSALEKLVAIDASCDIHMPRMGCGLAGGFWPKIEQIIRTTLLTKGYNVTVYDLE